MVFLLYPNRTYAEAMALSEKLGRHLVAHGHQAVLAPDEASAPVDMAIVIGGDGTVLRAVREYPGNRFPFWAINGGHLGYLTECEPEAALSGLERVLRGEYDIQRRLVLSGTLRRAGEEIPFFALNEAVLHRGADMRSMRIRLSVDGAEILTVSGDGMLVASPTGSTAYNLSAGGPILLPESEQLVITAICPHASLSAPLVVPADSQICMRLDAEYAAQSAGPCLVVDGALSLPLQAGDEVRCSRAAWTAGFVRTGEDGFYRRLQRRLALHD